jgi:hypothetical protein
MIVDPHDEGVIDILAARVKLRGINRAKAVGEVTSSLENLCSLKRSLDATMRSPALTPYYPTKARGRTK